MRSGRRLPARLSASVFPVSLALLLAAAAATTAFANDSAAELAVGGLVFKQTADIALESEELTISPDMVTVRYQFVNRTNGPVTLTVGFPFPDIDLSDDSNYAIPNNDSANFLGFETKVDGKPVAFTMRQTAHLGDKDVSAALKKLDVPLLPLGPQQARLTELPKPVRDRLIDEGLLLTNGTNDRGQDLYIGGWTVKTAAVRQQTFPPQAKVVVEHRYRTSLGLSFDTILRKGLRQSAGLAAEVKRYRADYCVNDAFLTGLDRMAGGREANAAKIGERRIAYVLKTGANWAGPIKEFRLVVDKQKADRLVSFCADNIRPISDSAVEFVAKDFVPSRDLKILIVGRF
jgi:Domain of unknown function (DUF4424)